MLFRLWLVASEMMMISIYPFLGCSVFCTVPVGHEDLLDGPRFYSLISSHIVAVALEVDDRLLTSKSINGGVSSGEVPCGSASALKCGDICSL